MAWKVKLPTVELFSEAVVYFRRGATMQRRVHLGLEFTADSSPVSPFVVPINGLLWLSHQLVDAANSLLYLLEVGLQGE